jgi:hypothetical protein
VLCPLTFQNTVFVVDGLGRNVKNKASQVTFAGLERSFLAVTDIPEGIFRTAFEAKNTLKSSIL